MDLPRDAHSLHVEASRSGTSRQDSPIALDGLRVLQDSRDTGVSEVHIIVALLRGGEVHAQSVAGIPTQFWSEKSRRTIDEDARPRRPMADGSVRVCTRLNRIDTSDLIVGAKWPARR